MRKPDNKEFEKAKDAKKTMKKLFHDLLAYKYLVITSIICSTIGAVLIIIGPNQLTKITDEIAAGIMGEINTDYIMEIGTLLVIMYLCSFAFNYLQTFLMNRVTQKYAKKLRKDISIKLNVLPLKYFDSNKPGDILSKVSNDVDSIASSLNQSIAVLLTSVVTLIAVVIMMFSTNIIMTITAITASLVGFTLMGFILSKSQKYFEAQQKELGLLNAHIEEIYSSFNVVKMYNADDDAIKDFNKYNKKLYHNARMSQFLSGLMMPLMNFVGNFGYVAVTVMGSYLVLEGKITIGVIVAYMIYVRLFINPLSNIAQSVNSLQLVAAAGERVFEFLDEEQTPRTKNKTNIEPSKVKGDITFKNVDFGYDADKLIIKDFSVNIKSGQKVAIVGPTGAGKTTLVNLLMRFYDITTGDVLIDKTSIKEISRENIHDLFCMVLQDTWVFEDTIYENVRFNQKNITDKEIEKVCKDVGIDHLIRTLPEAYNTILSDADSLSAGEKQLLTIARGMLKTSPFLILDEATSNIDTRTEVLVQSAMDKLMNGKTSFVIAHRLSTIKNADVILVLKDGNIIEQGNHKKLLSENGFYAKLYNSQFEE